MKRKRASVKRHQVTQPLDPSYRLIPLTQNQNAIVDTSDYEWLSQWNWHARRDNAVKGFYALRTLAPTFQKISMARIILGCGPEEQADHRNHQTLDNRRSNLRKATRSQNGSNARSGPYKGTKKTRHGRWEARICLNQRYIHLGTFASRDDAKKAYNEAAKLYHGEFACFE